MIVKFDGLYHFFYLLQMMKLILRFVPMSTSLIVVRQGWTKALEKMNGRSQKQKTGSPGNLENAKINHSR